MSILQAFDELFSSQNMWDKDFNHHGLNSLNNRAYNRYGRQFPELDLYPVTDGYELQADLPGLTKDNIKMTVENNWLKITGTRSHEIKREHDNYSYTERKSGQFARSVKLPFQPDPSEITARFEHGVLTVRIPKPESQAEKEIIIA